MLQNTSNSANDNSEKVIGAAILAKEEVDSKISYCLFQGNSASSGGAIATSSAYHFQISFSNFTNNT